jgi:uncharacterized Zn-binding protein involved in type VI secretion
MGMPWSRIGDMTTPCPMLCAPGCIHGPETNVQGNPTVIVGKMPACALGHIAVGCGPPAPYVAGSATVLCGNMPAVRIGDATAHGSTAMLGEFTVLVG